MPVEREGTKRMEGPGPASRSTLVSSGQRSKAVKWEDERPGWRFVDICSYLGSAFLALPESHPHGGSWRSFWRRVLPNAIGRRRESGTSALLVDQLGAKRAGRDRFLRRWMGSAERVESVESVMPRCLSTRADGRVDLLNNVARAAPSP